jgi:hypothetical protein
MGIKPSIEYVLLNESTWNFVHKLYGGGPKIYFKEEDEEGYNYSVIYE